MDWGHETTVQPAFCCVLTYKSVRAFGLDKNWHYLGFSSKDCHVRKCIFSFSWKSAVLWHSKTGNVWSSACKATLNTNTWGGKVNWNKVFAVRIFQLKKLELEKFKCMFLVINRRGKWWQVSSVFYNVSELVSTAHVAVSHHTTVPKASESTRWQVTPGRLWCVIWNRSCSVYSLYV